MRPASAKAAATATSHNGTPPGIVTGGLMSLSSSSASSRTRATVTVTGCDCADIVSPAVDVNTTLEGGISCSPSSKKRTSQLRTVSTPPFTARGPNGAS